jgi:hypothetical protein
MRQMLKWLGDKIKCVWNKSDQISHLATVLAFAAAAVGSYYAYGQLKTTNAQLEQANEQRKWQNYNEMNVRYAELYKDIPKEIGSGCLIEDFQTLDPDTKRWVRQFFDLYSEEYWLFRNQLIPEEMWTRRIHGGVRVNLSKYPALIQGYRYWKAAGSFTHPDDFADVVEIAIADAKGPKYVSSSNKLCGTRRRSDTADQRKLRNVIGQGD